MSGDIYFELWLLKKQFICAWDRKWRWIRSGVFCAAAERDQFKRSQLRRQWMVGFCICTCAPEIMKSGGGQLDMLAIYLLKAHPISWIIHTSGVYWFEIDVVFLISYYATKVRKYVCQTVPENFVTVLCQTHVNSCNWWQSLVLWHTCTWYMRQLCLTLSTAPMSGARARHCL